MRAPLALAVSCGALLTIGLLIPVRDVGAADQAKSDCFYNDGGQSLGNCTDLDGPGYWEHCDAGHPEGEYSYEDARDVLGCERH